MNRRVDIKEDIKRYQDTLSYTSSKVDYSVGEHLYMLPSDMALKIRPGTVGYNNKIIVSNEKFILGKNENVNSLKTAAMRSHKTNSLETPATEICTIIDPHSNFTLCQTTDNLSKLYGNNFKRGQVV